MQPRFAMQTLRLVRSARSFVSDARGIGHDMIHLVKLEAELAMTSTVSIAIFGTVTLFLALTGWILLVSAVVAWVAANWLSLPAALLVVALAMLAGAVPFVLLVRARTADLAFPATRRQLEGLRHGE